MRRLHALPVVHNMLSPVWDFSAADLLCIGFATSMPHRDGPEILVTGTAQATMTDAQIKGAGVTPVNMGVLGEHPTVRGDPEGTRPADGDELAGQDGAGAAAALLEFTVVQGWWDSQVWMLSQQVRLDDPLKDPRPSGGMHNNSETHGEAQVQAILVALQDGPASSRSGAGRVSCRETLPVKMPALLNFLPCLQSVFLHVAQLYILSVTSKL